MCMEKSRFLGCRHCTAPYERMLHGSQLVPSESIVGRSKLLKNIWHVAKLPVAGTHEPFEVAAARVKIPTNRAPKILPQYARGIQSVALSLKVVS